MSAIPYLPIQQSSPQGSRWMDFGDGRWGVQIDGGAGPNGYLALTPRVALLAGEVPGLIGTVTCRSTLVSTRNGFEGFGLWKIVRDDAGNVVWHNDPIASGNLDWWVNDLPSDWGKTSVIVQTPHEYQASWMQVAFVVRAPGGGQIDIDAADFRSHYRLRYGRPIAPAVYASEQFTSQTSPTLYGGRAGLFRARYLRTHQVRIASGQLVRFAFDGWINLAYSNTGSSGVINEPVFLALALKLLYVDGSESWQAALASDSPPPAVYRDTPVQRQGEFVAEKPIRQVELVLIMFSQALTDDPTGIAYVEHSGLSGYIESDLQVESGAE